MIADGERNAGDMRLNPESDRRFLDLMVANNLQAFDEWDQHELVKKAGIGSMELHTWIAAAAHKAAGGETPVEDFYSVAVEIGIAAGIVHGD